MLSSCRRADNPAFESLLQRQTTSGPGDNHASAIVSPGGFLEEDFRASTLGRKNTHAVTMSPIAPAIEVRRTVTSAANNASTLFEIGKYSARNGTTATRTRRIAEMSK